MSVAARAPSSVAWSSAEAARTARAAAIAGRQRGAVDEGEALAGA